MKKKRNILILFLLLQLPFTVIGAERLDKRFQILPLPQKMELLKGQGVAGNDLSYIIVQGKGEIPVLGTLLNSLPRKETQGKGVVLSLSEQEKNLPEQGIPESDEGYVLEVTPKGVTIQSHGQAGLFYGCQTLEQLMEDSRDHRIPIPCLRITDYPEISYRAVHFDTKHHLDRIEYYYRTIDKLARYKVNAVIWELEDKLRYTRRPEVGAPNAISKQEMQAICRYAKERNIENDPLVQGLGHASFILKHHWELRENPHSDWEFCPSDPRTYELQFELYRDAMEAMPYSKYLHVGGDEITAIGIDERCKATGKTAFELQMIWLKKVCDFAAEHGKTPIFWDDMPLKYADLWWLLHRPLTDDEIRKNWNTSRLDEAIKMFPKNCIYMRWHYEDPTVLSHRMLLEWYHKNGLNVMGATAAATGETPFMPRNNSRAQYINDFCQLVARNQLKGILATAWDDVSAHWETVMRGFIAQGEYSWHPGGRTVDEFINAHAHREFGLSGRQMEFLSEMEKAAFFFDGALVVEGARNPGWGVSETFQLMELPDPKKPGDWIRNYQGRLDTVHIESARYEKICKGLKVAEQGALRNRYTLDIYKQTNELFHYPVKLLEVLETYDSTKDEDERLLILDKIKTVCSSFAEMRSEFENVYSQTRFMEAPEGYIADQNHHDHLSALTNNSDWIFLYEIPMVRKVEKWLKEQEDN